MAFANRLAIIVGGIGGLGTSTGQLLRSQGAKLALLYAPFEAQNWKPTLKDAYGFSSESDAGNDVRGYECDITQPESVNEAFAAIAKDEAAFPSILINAAGIVNLHPLEDFPADDARNHYLINLFGPTLTGQAFAKMYLPAAGKDQKPLIGGRIVNIASQAAHVALHAHGPYCASKAGLIGLTKCQASEWGPKGITANTISPGPVMTSLGKKAWGDPDVRDTYLAAVPSGKFAEPDEVARIVEFLCRDESSNINGVDIRLDGGYTVR